MRNVIAVALLSAVSAVALASCGSGPAATPTPAPNPAVTVRLTGVGVTRSHEGPGYALFDPEDDIRLVIRVTSGDDVATVTLPPTGATAYKLTAQTMRPLDVTVFSTAEVASLLQIEILAIEEDNGDLAESLVGAGALTVDPSGILSSLAPSFIERLGTGDDAVGSYFGQFSSLDDWGSGRYIAVGDDDLRVSFEINAGGRIDARVVGDELPTATPTPAASPTVTLIPLQRATATVEPVVRQLAWLDQGGSVITAVPRGGAVTLFAQVTGLDGMTLAISISEVDPGSPDDLVATVQMTFANGVGRATWKAAWMEDGAFGFGGDPEYKFVMLGVDSPELTVR
jgi:hypothetical protein